MGRVQKNPEEAEQFYRKLSDTLAKFKGVDAIIMGDFNAKIGNKIYWTDVLVHTRLDVETTMGNHYTSSCSDII